MAKTAVTDWDTTAAQNTDINSIDIDENCAPSGINNAIREQMAQIATAMTTGALGGVGHIARPATATVLEADRGKCNDCSTAITLNLTAAATMGAGWYGLVKADGGDVTVDPDGSETIEGASTLTVSDGTTALIYTDATTWYVAFTTTVPSTDVTLAGTPDYITISGQEITRNAIDLTTDVTGDLPVTEGGTGRSSHTAYALIAGGTTSTAAQQSIASVGAANQVLTSNGAGALPTFQDVDTGAEVLISTSTASNDSTLAITGLSSTYYEYLIRMDNIIPSNNDRTLGMRTSTNGGSSYNSGASDYGWTYMGRTAGGAYFDDGDATDSLIRMVPTWGNVSNSEGSGWVSIKNPSRAKYTIIEWSFGYWDSSGAWNTVSGHGVRRSATDVDAIQFFFDTNNISTGTFKLYGIKA